MTRTELLARQMRAGDADVECLIDDIDELFAARGNAAYLGEPVSQTEHALQAAWAAEQEGAPLPTVVAALLHDVGHLLHDLPEHCADDGIDDRHERLGAEWLTRRFGPDVTEPVRLHVEAKRCLCATDADYHDRLSEASRVSLRLQGGPMSPTEAAEFLRQPFAEQAVALRRYDDRAKIRGLETPTIDYFRPHLRAVIRPSSPSNSKFG